MNEKRKNLSLIHIFYLLNPEKKITVEQLACDLAAQAWRLGKRVLIACETEAVSYTHLLSANSASTRA